MAQAKTALVFKVMLTVEADEIEPEIRQEVEYAMNEACSSLERKLTHTGIGYKITETHDIS
jgi:hypothetical protein